MQCVTFRYGNVYGPGQGRNGHAGVIHIFATHMLAGLPIHIFGDGLQTRDLVYVDDVAEANYLAVQGSATGLFHIGSGTAITLNMLFRRLAPHFGYTQQPQHLPAVHGEIREAVLDPSRALRELGWRATTSLDEGLVATVAALKASSPAASGVPAAGAS